MVEIGIVDRVSVTVAFTTAFTVVDIHSLRELLVCIHVGPHTVSSD